MLLQWFQKMAVYKNAGQIARFVLVGVVNTTVGYSVVFFLMLVLGLGAKFSNVVGYAVCLVFAYIMHRKYTFKSKGAVHGEFIRFFAVFLVSYGVNYAVLAVVLDFHLVGDVMAQVVSGFAYVSTSFLLNKLVVYIDKPDYQNAIARARR